MILAPVPHRTELAPPGLNIHRDRGHQLWARAAQSGTYDASR